MNWIHAFEFLCYALTVLFLTDVILRRSREELWLFISAALAAFVLELLAVRVTGIYHYNPDFYVNIGTAPYQFPFFGGLMWGGLTVYAARIAERLNLSAFKTALVGGWLIVTMDLFLDVAAIRLDGGFWVWDGRAITQEITHHAFMSVIWVNFLGYLFETPAMIYLFRRTEEKRRAFPWWKQLLAYVGIAAAGIAFVGAASGLSLFLNGVTDEWFACIAFLLLWFVILALTGGTVVRNKQRRIRPKRWDIPVLIYWFSMYAFCAAALARLGFASDMPVYFAAAILFGVGTAALSMTGKPE